jgi:signal transduction histidine kinase/DNA-binding response OmpR family regulator
MPQIELSDAVITKIRKFIEDYVFNERLDISARMINMIFIMGFVGAAFVLISRIVLGTNPVLLSIIVAILLCIAFLMYVCNRYHVYKFGTWLAVIAISEVLFPVSYFFLGGLNSSMPAYFILSIVVIFFLLQGRSLIIMLLIHLALITACYLVSSAYPGLVLPLTDQQRTLDAIFSIIILGCLVGSIIKFQKAIFDVERAKNLESSEALASALSEVNTQDKLLRVSNEVAEVLLLSDAENINEYLHRGMELLGTSLDIDRLYVWRDRHVKGKRMYIQEYGWIAEGSHESSIIKNRTAFSYLETIPEWETLFSRGGIVNGPLTSLSINEQTILAPYDIVSILVVPAYLQGNFWGFVSYDDCRQSRTFTEDEVSILKSGALMFANTIERSNDEKTIQIRLKQQQLMSNISQGFISERPMAELIQEALGQVSEFLHATRALIAVADKKTEESYPIYQWATSEEWIPDPSKTGFNEFFSSAFPQKMPTSSYVEPVYCNNTHDDYDGKYRVFEIADLKSFIWAPIYVESEFWGLLSIEECVEYRIWNESDRQLVGSVVSAISGAVSRDIIEQQRETALEEAVKASKAKGDFLSNMSHEMRTPMNAIIGMTSIGMSAESIERKDYAFEKIDDASNHLLGVINDILDMSKIEADKLELYYDTFDFERMLRKVFDVINFKVEERKQVFKVNIDHRIPRMLYGDDQRLAQVITNLLSNAVKFTPEGGEIRLDARYLKEEDGLFTLQVDVADTGIGINDEQKARLFNPFEQAESGTQRKFGGTGLGLVISQRIVEMMGGTIWIESELDKGSTFLFTFKMERARGTGQSLLKEGVDWSNLRIMAVDDDHDVLDYFVELSKLFKIRCTVAANGEEALAKVVSDGPYDIYFIDWKMPGMDGLELSRRIKERDDDHSVVTMVSSVEWGEIEERARAVGVDKYLCKPLFPSTVADLINECIGSEQMIESHKNAEAELDDFSGYHVLLAEDMAINQEIVLALLEPTGLKLSCADNGAIAVQMFSAAPDTYDAIFMDVQMPEMDGYEAARQIRALDLPRAKEIPIIAMTANVFKEDVEKALAAGMNDHLGKPIDMEDVLAKLRNYLQSSS